MRRLVVLVALCSICAFAQTALDGITTSASKTITLLPDSAVFTVDVTSASGTTVDQAVAWIKDTGITATNLVGAGTTQDYQPVPPGAPPSLRMVHEFQITVPYARVKEMSDKLRAATTVVADAGGSLSYGLNLSASDDALQLARQRILPDLIAELKRRADTLAGAAGLQVGSIQSISDNSYISGMVAYSRFVLSSSSSGLQATFQVSAKFGVVR